MRLAVAILVGLVTSSASNGQSFDTGAPFRAHVGVVVGKTSEKEVVAPNAWRVVAVVTNGHIVRDRTYLNFERHTVGQQRYLALRNSAITAFVPRSIPNPTSSTLLDVTPEPLRKSAGSGVAVVTLLTAEPASTRCDCRTVQGECGSTMITYTVNETAVSHASNIAPAMRYNT